MLIWVMGALMAFPPFVTDLVLPALPAISEYFGASVSLTQMSLTASMIGLALGQLVIGPLSDKYGRKRLLIISIVLFFLTTVLCLVSPNIYAFNVLRVLQGMAASGGVVMSRSIASDRTRGPLLNKVLGVLSAINGIAPVAAPVVGGILLKFAGWKLCFAFLLVYGLFLFFSSLKLRESLPKHRRSSASVFSMFKSYGLVLTNPTFIIALLVYSFSAAVLFAYISASTFILQGEVYQISSVGFSICFAVNAVFIALGCASGGRFKNEKTPLVIGGIGIIIFAIFVAAMLHIHASIFLLEASFILMLYCFGILQPSATAIALRAEREHTGTASATIGALGFIAGGIVSPLVGLGDIFNSTGVVLVVCSALTCITSFICVKKC